jgi:hypothetical protein
MNGSKQHWQHQPLGQPLWGVLGALSFITTTAALRWLWP